MIIKEIIVKHFQIHEKTTIKLTDGLNVIIGDTGKGKSSLVRALDLLIRNKPVSGEAIFKNKHTNKPVDITIIDGKGNEVRRFKKMYYVNDSKPLKAFKTDIPKPVAELFPLKDINWQKQLDSHFLVLSTGGAAAKTLNSSTGMEDQEYFLKELKSTISGHKSNIKTLIASNQSHKEKINELKPAKRLFMNAKAIRNMEIELSELRERIYILDSTIDEIEKYEVSPVWYDSLIQLIDDVKEIESLINESNTIELQLDNLINLCDQLREVNKHSNKSSIYNILLQSIISIEHDQIKKSKLNISIKSITSIIEEVNSLRGERKQLTVQLGRFENQFSKILLEMGECPLCGTVFGKEKHSC